MPTLWGGNVLVAASATGAYLSKCTVHIGIGSRRSRYLGVLRTFFKVSWATRALPDQEKSRKLRFLVATRTFRPRLWVGIATRALPDQERKMTLVGTRCSNPGRVMLPNRSLFKSRLKSARRPAGSQRYSCRECALRMGLGRQHLVA